MNSNRNLLKRLLKLYPIKVVKEYFQETGNFADAIESITGNNTQQSIKDFAKRTIYIQSSTFTYIV